MELEYLRLVIRQLFLVERLLDILGVCALARESGREVFQLLCLIVAYHRLGLQLYLQFFRRRLQLLDLARQTFDFQLLVCA